MPRRHPLISAADFDGTVAWPLVRASLEPAGLGQHGRMVRYVFSTPGVARDFHTIAAGAWQLDNYLKNPVFLWAHDDTLPPIGRIVEIGSFGQSLKGTVEYAEGDLNPFADTVYQLVRAGYINAVSVSWMPLQWSFSKDKARPGGVDFTQVDLLEVSQVPVPALPSALAEARSRGIDTGPLYDWAERLLDQGGMVLVPRPELEQLRRAAKMPKTPKRAADDKEADWKVGASRDLPIEDSDEWDGPAAAKSIFEWAGGDDFDADKAARGFLAYDSAHADKRGSYKLPIATVVDGELKVPKGAIRAAASRLPDTDIPDAVKNDAGKVLDHYKEKAGIGDEEKERAARAAAAAKPKRAVAGRRVRGLYHVAWLAYMVEDLAFLQDCVEFEAAIEEDGSKVPAQLADALHQLGQILVDMTEEEVAELLSGGEDDDAVDVVVGIDPPRAAPSRRLTKGQRAVRAFARMGRSASIADKIMPEDLAMVARMIGDRFARAGRVLSADNERCLRDAHEHMTRACDMVKSIFDQVDPDDDDDDDDAAPAGTRASRVRRLRTIQLTATRHGF